MIYTKCILKEPEESDGLRISVMSRHTLEDGETPDKRISDNSYDVWLPILAPAPKLVGHYYKRGLPWEEFEKQYLSYLREPRIAEKVEMLAEFSLERVVTLLCIEENADKCHRRLLAEECQKYFSELAVEHR